MIGLLGTGRGLLRLLLRRGRRLFETTGLLEMGLRGAGLAWHLSFCMGLRCEFSFGGIQLYGIWLSSSFASGGSRSLQSPTSPMSQVWKIRASGSVLMATMVPAVRTPTV